MVGVTGPGRERAALQFAAECAGREGREVVLAHAFHPAHPAPPPGVLLSYADASEVGDWVVKEVGDEFKELTGGSVAFVCVAVAGAPWRVLSDLGRVARLLVLQHHRAHGLGRLLTGHTVTGAASHTRCRSCPSTRTGHRSSRPARWSLVSTRTPDRRRHWPRPSRGPSIDAPVRVVHAWRLDAVYDDIIMSRVAAGWREEQKRVLTAAVTALRARHPSVRVEIDVRHQRPADVLVDDSQVARLVVLGRHGRAPWSTHHLGSITRTVLRESKSPVMVVPPHAVDVPGR